MAASETPRRYEGSTNDDDDGRARIDQFPLPAIGGDLVEDVRHFRIEASRMKATAGAPLSPMRREASDLQSARRWSRWEGWERGVFGGVGGRRCCREPARVLNRTGSIREAFGRCGCTVLYFVDSDVLYQYTQDGAPSAPSSIRWWWWCCGRSRSGKSINDSPIGAVV